MEYKRYIVFAFNEYESGWTAPGGGLNDLCDESFDDLEQAKEYLVLSLKGDYPNDGHIFDCVERKRIDL